MKRLLTYVMALLLVAACYDDSEIKSRLDDMDQRLTYVEALTQSLNTQLGNLQKLIDGKLFISDIADNSDGTHVITFVNKDGEMTTMTLSDGESPDISVKQAPDGKWYWTVNGEWLTDAEGKSVPVTGDRGVTPSMKIENGKWYVSYDNGLTYVECGQATGEDGDAFFKDAKLSEDGKLAYLTLADGTVLTFEVYKEFGIAIDVTSPLIYSGQTKEFAYVITGADKNTVLEVLPKGNWEAEAVASDDSHGVIKVKAPDSAEVGKVILLLGDGADKTLMRTLTFVAGHMEVSTSSVESPANGGTFDVDVTTNLEFTAELESDQTWAHLVETKAYEVYTRTVSVKVDKNEMPYARQTRMTLKNQDNVIETIVIYQNPVTYPDDVMVLMLKPFQKDSIALAPVTYLRNTEFYVDWGDGSPVDTVAASFPMHKYSDPDRVYPVQLSGTVYTIGRSTKTNHQADLIEVIQWGNTSLAGIQFEYQENLERIPAPKGDELKKVANCNGMFRKCKKLKTVPVAFMDGISSQTTNFSNMFDGCESLEYLDPDFFRNFAGYTGKYSPSFRAIFSGCKSLKTVPTFKYFQFNSTSCQDLLNQTFVNCESLETIPDPMFNETVNKVVNAKVMGSTFMGCKSLKTIPASFWENIQLNRLTSLMQAFKDCSSLTSESLEFLNEATGVYIWTNTFNGCESLTTLPEKEIEVDGQTVSVPIYKRGEDAYKASFANRSCSSTGCFTGCINLEGYYDKIPVAWGGGWDGTTEKPTIEVTASYPEGEGYYSIDFLVKGKGVSSAYYYLSAKALVDEALPKYNNSYSELCEKKGIQIEADYLNAINSDKGLTLGFTQGVPNVEYILIVSGKNMFGEAYAYKVQATTAIPKGTDEYDRYLGEWTVTSAGSATTMPGYESMPISFDIKIEPFRVDSIYNVYGWGVTKFTDVYPVKMYFEDGKLCAWTGAHHGSVLYEGYPYSDGINYNVVVNSFAQYDDGSYGVYMANGEKVGEAEYAEDGFDMVGVKSKYYEELGYNVVCQGFDVCLSMGGQGWSKIFIAPETVKDGYVIKSGDVKFSPYIIGPFTFKRKSASASTASVTTGRNQALIRSGKCLPVRFGKVNAPATEPAPGFYKL